MTTTLKKYARLDAGGKVSDLFVEIPRDAIKYRTIQTADGEVQEPYTEMEVVTPSMVYHPDIAVDFIECPDDVTVGSTKNADGTWTIYVPPAPVLLEPVDEKTALIKQIDADVDAIYAAAIGNRGPEYDQASADASAYKAANYAGTVPSSVQSWADAKKWTAQQAADDILVAAAKLAAARDAIRAHRLQCKEDARNAATANELGAVRSAWSLFATYIRGQLGI